MDGLTTDQKTLILNNISELVVLHDEDMRISGLNKATCEAFGVRYEDVIGHHCCELLAGEESFCKLCLAQRVKESGSVEESEIESYDGRAWFARAYPIKDDSGHVTGCVNVLRDITERKWGREVLKYLVQGTSSVTGTEFLHEMVEALAHWLNFKWIVLSELDDSGAKLKPLVFWSAGSLHEIPEFNVNGNLCKDAIKEGFLVVSQGLQRLYNEDEDLREMGAECYAGLRLQDKAGTPLGVLCALDDKPFAPPSNLEEILTIFGQRASAEILRLRMERQLVEAKEKAESGDKAKTEFLATISHELLTPLNAVIGFSEMLEGQKMGSLNERQTRCIHNVSFSGKKLQRLIADVLDLSRSEFGFLQLNWAHFNLMQVFDEVFESLQFYRGEKSIDVVKDLSPEPETLYGDKDRFQRVLSNLIGNAIKFTPVGGRVSVTSKLLSDNGEVLLPDSPGKESECLFVSVKDTGIGIEDEDLPGLFEIFHQVDSSYSREYSGAGVGLSLARRFIELHGGRIWVESSGKDQGATFYFVVPLRKS